MSILTVLLSRVPRSWMNSLAGIRQRHRSVDRCAFFVAGLIRGRDSIIQTGAGRGLRFNPGRSAASYVLGTTEPETQTALARLLRPGMSFYDIGANVGFCSIIAARLVGPAGHVAGFEPLPENARVFRHNVEINHFRHISLFEMALSIADGEMSFARSDRMTDGRLESVNRLPSEYAGDIRVAVRRLDSIVDEAALPPADLIKIDVEGAENDVLVGAAATLARYRPVLIIELHGTNDTVLRTLIEAGYCATTLYPYPSIGEAYWNAAIVAVPSEKPELLQLVMNDRIEFAFSLAVHNDLPVAGETPHRPGF